jgi:hypothetical protein
VIECGRQPGDGIVAGAAIRAELLFVRIILGVTRIAISWRALENVIDMATGASHAGMCAGQLEARQIVIEGGRLPAAGGMTRPTIVPQLTVVGIVLRVTGLTCLRGSFKIRDRAGPSVAGPTSQGDVFSGQMENNVIMAEIVPVRVDSVVARQAIIPVSLQMRLHEIGLDLLVTGYTGSLIKFGIGCSVAGAAEKRGTI